MKFSSKLKFSGKKRELQAYYNALKPDEQNRKRAKYSVKLGRRIGKKTHELRIDVKAKDFVAYRATTTSILNVMAIVEKTLKAVNKDSA